MTYSSEFIQNVIRRGFMHQATDLEALDSKMSKEVVVGYIGFDATAPSLHVGSLMQIMLLRLLQKSGHKPIVVMGGGTTKIGDPSDKDAARPVLTDDVINTNIEGIQKVFSRYITFGDGPTDAIIVNNNDWLDQLPYLDFLRNYGRHITINRMLTFDSVKLRLEREQPLTFLEFNYMILQAYDFLELNRRYGCSLQFGGREQWGNIINGMELIRRLESKDSYGLTTPLLTTASGAKMGKTAAGAVWLNPEMLGSFDFWQFWRNRDDADVPKFLRLFTELPEEELKRLEALEGSEINHAKEVLADEVTRLAHGQDALDKVKESIKSTFGGSGVNLEAIPTVEVSHTLLHDGVPFYELIKLAGFASSNGEAKRLIQGGGARLNDEPIRDEFLSVTSSALTPEGHLKLSSGKKKFALIRPV